jgi:signal transduction histidine kinase/streptogramin lyase
VTSDFAVHLAGARIRTILGERDRSLVLATGRFSVFTIHNDRLSRVRLDFPSHLLPAPWASELLDRAGRLWIGSGEGLFQFEPKAAGAPPAWMSTPKKFDVRDGLSDNAVGMLFEDSRGDVWIGAGAGPGPVISRWRRSTGRVDRYTSPFARVSRVASFAEIGSGTIWVSFRDGGFARIGNETVEAVPGTEDIASGALYVDRSGRLWAGSLGGAFRFDDPSAPRPTIVRMTMRDGLASNVVNGFAEDRLGRLYFVTVAGIDRLDVATGAIRHYGTADGLTGEMVDVYADSNGILWFTTGVAVSRLAPDDEPRTAPPEVRIAGVTVAGIPVRLPELGTARAGDFRLGASQSRVQIDFFALSPDLAEPIRYQSRLEGVEGDWGPPTPDRSITYASLAPGSYRFTVRAVGSGGRTSESDASVSFNVLPPFWRQWWFVGLMMSAVASALFGAHRYRLSHMLRLERVRQRIATDLHDDIGASLSQIAILSDLGRDKLGTRDIDGAAERLSTIAATSRELVDTMSDIVWAVNPHRDSVDDLVHRMRRFASDTLEAANVALTFASPPSGATTRLGPNTRREILLILKESVTNIVRHAHCTEASIEFRVDGFRLGLWIRDNGRGFLVDIPQTGNGLASMRRRVEALGGHFTIDSATDSGTTIVIDVPIA